MSKTLIIEDDPGRKFYCKTILEKEGQDVDTAYSGDDAIKKIKMINYNFIIVNLDLSGGMWGLDIIKKIRPNLPDTQIIAYSSLSNADLSEKVIKAGADNFIIEPFNQEELIQVLSSKRSKGDFHYKSQPKRKMLIVDDEIEILDIFIENFINDGYEVDTSTFAEETISKVKNNKYDLMLVDLVLPGRMNGLDLIQKIRNLLPNIFIIATSGFSGKEMTERVIHAGANSFISKPFEYQDINKIITGGF